MSRVFAALEIPDNILDEIIELRSEIYQDENVRWEKKSKLHITIKFFGEVSAQNISRILECLNNIISDYSKFELAFNRFGIFEFKGKPKIVWAGIQQNQKLEKFAYDLNNKMKAIGFAEENKKFHPHLTLLRIRGKEKMQYIKKFENYNFENIPFTGNRITLYESKLLKSGSVYRAIKSFELN